RHYAPDGPAGVHVCSATEPASHLDVLLSCYPAAPGLGWLHLRRGWAGPPGYGQPWPVPVRGRAVFPVVAWHLDGLPTTVRRPAESRWRSAVFPGYRVPDPGRS